MLKFFRDNNDYYKKIDDSKIINITGLSGSGKSTFANELKNEYNTEIIEFDYIFGFCKTSQNNSEVYVYINDKYKNLNNIRNKSISYKRKMSKKYSNMIYNDIVNYINEDKYFILVGTQIYSYVNPNNIKGTIYVKMTSIKKCIYRCFYEKSKIKAKSNIIVNVAIKCYYFYQNVKKSVKMIFVNKVKINRFILELEKLGDNKI